MTQQISRDMVADAQRPQDATPIEASHLEDLFAGLIRYPHFFDEARRLVSPNQFDSGNEPHFQLLWTVLCRIRDTYHGKWVRPMIAQGLMDALRHTPWLPPALQHYLLADPGGYLHTVFYLPLEEISLEYCRELLRRFLEERTLAAPLRAYLTATKGCPANFHEFLDGMSQQRLRIQATGSVPSYSAVPAMNSTFRPASDYRITGADYVDTTMGGLRAGDVIGVLGVTGGGKTTLACHLAVSLCKVETEQAAKEGRPARPVLFFTYEEPYAKIWPRFVAIAAQIPRDRLETMVSPASELTTRENLKEYERALAGRGEMLCEQERWLRAQVQLAPLHIIDCSGSEEHPEAGAGGPEQAATYAEQMCQQLGQPPAFGVIDWAGAMIARLMQRENLDEKKKRTMLIEMSDKLRRGIAEKYQCPVVLTHQLAGAQGKNNATKLMHHSDASESKDFAHYQAVCGCLGVPDPVTGVRLLNWSKVRFRAQERIAPVALKIDDVFGGMVNVSAQYCLDDARRAIVSLSDQARAGAQGAIRAAAGPQAGPRGLSYRAGEVTPQEAEETPPANAEAASATPTDRPAFSAQDAADQMEI